MHIDLFGAALNRQLDHGMDVIFVAMHATWREQTENMHGTVVLDRFVHPFGEGAIVEKRTGSDRAADAGVLLIDDAACPKIEMTHLGVAHLTCR